MAPTSTKGARKGGGVDMNKRVPLQLISICIVRTIRYLSSHGYDPSAGQEGARAGGHSWRKVLGRYGRGQLREDEGDGQVGLVRALVHLL